MRLRIIGRQLPGRSFHDAGYSECRWNNVHVGIQRGREVIDLVPGDAPTATFEVDVRLRTGRDGALEPAGPFVHGRPGARFVYLSWGDVDADGSFEMFRRIKLWLRGLDPGLLEQAARGDRALQVELALTDGCGGPRCGGVEPDAVTWSVVDGAASGEPTR